MFNTLSQAIKSLQEYQERYGDVPINVKIHAENLHMKARDHINRLAIARE